MKKNVYYLMAIISGILASLVMRYPMVPHEQGWDSFMIHQMAQSISTYGYMKWIFNPLSYMGYYPYSYASGVPVLLSGFSQVSGLDMEHTILFFCMVESILFFLFAYMAASLFTRNFIFKFLVGMVYSLSPGVVWFTDWTISTRGPVIMLFPLFIFLIFMAFKHKKLSKKYLFLSLLIFLTAMVIHNMYIFLVVVVLSYLLAKILFLIKSKTFPYKKGIFYTISRIVIPILFILLFLGLIYTPILFQLDIQAYTSINKETIFEVLHAYGGKIGIVSILIPAGIFYLLKNKRKKLPDMFLVVNTLLIAPILLSPYYVSLGFLFVFLILCIYPFSSVKNTYKRLRTEKYKRYIIFIVLILVILWAAQSKFHAISVRQVEKIDEDYCEPPVYDTAITLKYMGDGGFISNDLILHGRISAYNERKNIINHVYPINNYINSSSVHPVLKKDVLSWFNGGPYKDPKQLHLDYRYWSQFRYNVRENTVNDLRYKYDIQYYVENLKISGEINYYNRGVYQSKYFRYLDESQYTLYQNQEISIRYFR